MYNPYVCSDTYHVWGQNDKWCQCRARVSPAWRPWSARLRSKINFRLLQRRIRRAEARNTRPHR